MRLEFAFSVWVFCVFLFTIFHKRKMAAAAVSFFVALNALSSSFQQVRFVLKTMIWAIRFVNTENRPLILTVPMSL